MTRKSRKQGSRVVYKVCRLCGHAFELGHNGTVKGCDVCLGIQRDKNGYAWLPDESEMHLQDIETGIEEVVTRAEAFG